MDVTSPVNGAAITIWIRRGEFYAALANDTFALLRGGKVRTSDVYTIVNEVMRLAGY
jgi:hypothetical protein